MIYMVDNSYEVIIYYDKTAKEIYEKYNNKIFLCFEKTGDFCHRHIVSSWLKYHGFECEEL